MPNIEHSKKIRVIKPQDVVWEEAMVYAEEKDPAGEEFTAAATGDERFSCGLWQRKVQGRYFERPYHEIAYIIKGKVEITDEDGDLIVAGPGDILVTPQGSKGYWKNLSPVKKFYTIYEDPGDTLDAYTGPGGF